jgi:hypothetical protein
MKHKSRLIFIGILISLFILSLGSASAEMPDYIKIKNINMELHGTDATFTVNYELDAVARIYILMLGSSSLEPVIDDLFHEFNNVSTISTMYDHAVVKATDVTYQNPEQGLNYYFHDSCPFGTTVNLYVKFPSGVEREHLNVICTPNLFFEIS